MAKSKYETHVLPNLLVIERWARDGATDKEIAQRLGISEDSLYEYKKQHSEFSEVLKRGKEVVDAQVENALLKRALGYDYNEVVREPVRSKGGEVEETLHKYLRLNRLVRLKKQQLEWAVIVF